jgi:beta-hydroxylase
MINYPFAAIAAVYVGSFAYLYQRCNDRLPLHKYFSNHVLLLAPLNFLFTYFTKGRQGAVFDPRSVPGLETIKQNYEVIRSEAKVLLDTGVFQRPPAVDEPGYNTFEKGGWRLYPLKWYTKESGPRAVAACPKTCAVMDSIPAVRSAMFTVLPPGAKLGRHHDPVASSLRYHLGLLTPNSEQCALTLHSAINKTDIVRVILFCDVEKTQLRGPVKRLADAVNNALVAKFTGANDQGKLSWVSWAYKPIYKVRSYVKEQIKPRSLIAYNIIKYGSIVLLLYLLYLLLRLI